MTKEDLSVEVVRRVGGSKKEAIRYIDAVADGIKVGMKRDGKVSISNFATFIGKVKPAYEARNPKTGEPVHVPDRVHPKIKQAPIVEEFLNSKD